MLAACIALQHPFAAMDVAHEFIQELVCLHGYPQVIIYNRDCIFLSQFWTELFHLQGTKLHQSMAYHPKMNGKTEEVNYCLEIYLRCFSSQQPSSWLHWLPWA